MRFYEVTSIAFIDDMGCVYFTTKREAISCAKEIAKNGDSASVDMVEIRDTSKKTIVALANQRGWCANRETVFEIEGK